MSKIVRISDVCPLIFKAENNSRKGIYNRSESQKGGVYNTVNQIFDSETIATKIYFETNSLHARYSVFKNGTQLLNYSEKNCTLLSQFTSQFTDVTGFERIATDFSEKYNSYYVKVGFATTNKPTWNYTFNGSIYESTAKMPPWIKVGMQFYHGQASHICTVLGIVYDEILQQEVADIGLYWPDGAIIDENLPFSFSNIDIEECNVFHFSLPDSGEGEYYVKLEVQFNGVWEALISECYTLQSSINESDLLLSYWSEDERYNGFLYNYLKNGINLSIRNNILLPDSLCEYLDFSTDTDNTFEEQMQSFERLNGYIPKVLSFETVGKTGIEIQRIKSILKHDILYVNYQRCVQIGEITTDRQGENVYSLSAKLALIESDFYQNSQAQVFEYKPNPENAECLKGYAAYSVTTTVFVIQGAPPQYYKTNITVNRSFADGNDVGVVVKLKLKNGTIQTYSLSLKNNELSVTKTTNDNWVDVNGCYIFTILNQEQKNTGIVHFAKLEQYNTITSAFTGVEIDNVVGVVGYTPDYLDRGLCPVEDVRPTCEIYGELTFSQINASQYDEDVYDCTFEEIKSE